MSSKYSVSAREKEIAKTQIKIRDFEAELKKLKSGDPAKIPIKKELKQLDVNLNHLQNIDDDEYDRTIGPSSGFISMSPSGSGSGGSAPSGGAGVPPTPKDAIAESEGLVNVVKAPKVVVKGQKAKGEYVSESFKNAHKEDVKHAAAVVQQNLVVNAAPFPVGDQKKLDKRVQKDTEALFKGGVSRYKFDTAQARKELIRSLKYDFTLDFHKRIVIRPHNIRRRKVYNDGEVFMKNDSLHIKKVGNFVKAPRGFTFLTGYGLEYYLEEFRRLGLANDRSIISSQLAQLSTFCAFTNESGRFSQSFLLDNLKGWDKDGKEITEDSQIIVVEKPWFEIDDLPASVLPCTITEKGKVKFAGNYSAKEAALICRKVTAVDYNKVKDLDQSVLVAMENLTVSPDVLDLWNSILSTLSLSFFSIITAVHLNNTRGENVIPGLITIQDVVTSLVTILDGDAYVLHSAALKLILATSLSQASTGAIQDNIDWFVKNAFVSNPKITESYTGNGTGIAGLFTRRNNFMQGSVRGQAGTQIEKFILDGDEQLIQPNERAQVAKVEEDKKKLASSVWLNNRYLPAIKNDVNLQTKADSLLSFVGINAKGAKNPFPNPAI